MSTSANPNPDDVTPPEASAPPAPPAADMPVPPPPPAAPTNLPAAAPAPAAGYGYAPSGAEIPVFPNGKPRLDVQGNPVSEKSRLAAALLCWFLGVFGVHRFYTGKIGTGILMIFTLGGLGIWALIDFIMILVGSFKDKEGLPLVNW
jgi:hypothetical protein